MRNLNKVVSGLVIVGTILSTSTVALAASKKTAAVNTATQSSQQTAGKIAKGNHKDKGFLGKNISANVENNLKTLVSAGVITQDESDKILALAKQEEAARQAEMDKVKNMTEEERKTYFDSTKTQKDEKKSDIFSKAVSGGIITQAKADTAKAKLEEAEDAEKKTKVTEALKGLVTAGTITQGQSDKVAATITSLDSNKPASTAAAQTEVKTNPLSALVSDGTLTQAQLDEVSKVLPMGKGHGKGGHRGFEKNSAAQSTTDANSSATAAANSGV